MRSGYPTPLLVLAWLCVGGCAASPDSADTSVAGQAGAPAPTAGTTQAGGQGVAGTQATAGNQAAAGVQAGSQASTAGTHGQTGGTTAGAGGNAGLGAAGAQAGTPACSDSCPKPGGVDWLCKLRFMYGFNYAWHHFGADIGGLGQWSQLGISQNQAVDTEFGELAAAGVSVLRFWVFPDFRGDGVVFDSMTRPTGLGGTALSDLARLLELAHEHDLYLMLTLFSFDNFHPTRTESGVAIPGIQPLVVDGSARAQLMEQVVRPVAQAVAQSPYADRVIAWDVINEPEWAMYGPSLYGGDEDFDPDPDLQSVTHGEMDAFVADVIAVLREESQALVSVGGAAIKWRHAWSEVDVDFHHFHIYDWVDQYWPYDRSPTDYGLDDKPVVMGEFPAAGLARADYATLLSSFYANGYGGALGWSYSDYEGSLAPVRAFADQHPCETRY